MTGTDLLKAIGGAEDKDLLISEAVAAKPKARKLYYMMAAAAAALVLGVGIFAAAHFAKGPEHGSHTAYLPTAEPTETATATLQEEAFAELYKELKYTDGIDRVFYENGLESWLAFADKHEIEYAAVEGEVLSTRYYLHWVNDEYGASFSWGAEVSEIRIVRTDKELNKPGIRAGSTVYVTEHIRMFPVEEDILALMSEKTGKQLTRLEELEEVESFYFEVTPEDAAKYSFTPLLDRSILPKQPGRSYYMLVIPASADKTELEAFELSAEIYTCNVSIPTDEDYASLHDRYGFIFDEDIEWVAEDLKKRFE